MTPDEFVRELGRARVSAILRTDDQRKAAEAMNAALRGGGPAWVRSVLGPMPFLKIVPTNGIDLDNMDQWFAAGAYAGGFVASLFAPQRRCEWQLGRYRSASPCDCRARELA